MESEPTIQPERMKLKPLSAHFSVKSSGVAKTQCGGGAIGDTAREAFSLYDPSAEGRKKVCRREAQWSGGQAGGARITVLLSGLVSPAL